MTSLLKSARTVNKMHMQTMKLPRTHPRYEAYKYFLNTFSKLKKLTKQTHYETKLNGYKSENREDISEILVKQQDKSNCTEYFKINSRLERDPNLISDGFCKYFTDEGAHLVNKIPKGKYDSNYCMKSFISQNLFLTPI